MSASTTFNAFLSAERDFAPALTPRRPREFMIGASFARELFAFADTPREFAALKRLNDFRADEHDVHVVIRMCDRHGRIAAADMLLDLLQDAVA